MAFKAEIKKAITNNSRYVAIKVWKPEYDENMLGEGTLRIEVTVRKRKRKRNKQVKSAMASPKPVINTPDPYDQSSKKVNWS